MTEDQESSTSIRTRFSLWVVRILARLGLLSNPDNERRNQASGPDSTFENRWAEFRIGLQTTAGLVVVDIAAVGLMVYFQVSTTMFFVGTILILVLNVPIQLWALSRVWNARQTHILEE